MVLWLIFGTSFLVALSGAMMPGPLLTVTIGEAARRGAGAGILVSVGHALLELVLVLALTMTAGLAAFLTQATVSRAVAGLGGVVLAWFGWGIVRDAVTGRVFLPREDSETPAFERSGSLQPVVSGVITSLANPYWVIWWATVGLGYITVAMKEGGPGVTVFYTGHILADFLWYSLISVAIAGSRRFMSDRVYRGILVVCGLFLFGLAAYFIYRGLTGV